MTAVLQARVARKRSRRSWHLRPAQSAGRPVRGRADRVANPLALLGTVQFMTVLDVAIVNRGQAPLYAPATLWLDRFDPSGLAIVVPTTEEREFVHGIYMGELLLGDIRDASRDKLVSVIAAMRDRDGIDAVILGGTELALTLTGHAYAGVAVLNTARIHVEAAADWLLEDVPPDA